MGMKELAEGIILQSMEDLWDAKYRKDSIEFFEGKGVFVCTEMAGMNLYEQVRLFNLVHGIITRQKLNTKTTKGKLRPQLTA